MQNMLTEVKKQEKPSKKITNRKEDEIFNQYSTSSSSSMSATINKENSSALYAIWFDSYLSATV